MRARPTSIFAMTLSCALTACSGGDEGGGSDDDLPPDDVEEDTVAPYVVSSSPADGAAGVRKDAEVVFVFSEPMDQDSVEGTLDASDLGEVTLSWNEDGDILTITPQAELEYAEGFGVDPGAVTPLQYAVVIGTNAADLAGNKVDIGYQTAFTTLKSMEAVFELDHALTGSTTPEGGQLGDDDPVWIGDDPEFLEYRGFFTFDISMLPLSAIEIASATFSTRQLGEYGSPYQSLGTKLKMDHISFDSWEAEPFTAAPHAEMGDFAEAEQVIIEVDVTAAVDDDRINRLDRGELSQYRLRFDLASDEDDTADLAVISRELAELQVTYLNP